MSETMAAAARVPYRRRKILVQPAYQLRVAAVILTAILFYSGLLGLLLFYPLMVEFEAAGGEQQYWMAEQILSLHRHFWPSVFLVAILAAIQSLFVTHRVVGPAFHLRRVVKDLGEGKLNARAHLRRFDQLKELEGALNALGDGLERQAQARAQAAERFRAALSALSGELARSDLSPEARQALAELERLAPDRAL